jgi:hypothetical protein
MPIPKVTKLEAIAPWKYSSWNRLETDKKLDVEGIPETMK